jgi:hypothetical protein
LAGVFLTLPNGTAHAYLDPGSGSFIIQILIASLAGALLSLRIFWSRIIGLLRKPDPPAAEAPEDPSTEDILEN